MVDAPILDFFSIIHWYVRVGGPTAKKYNFNRPGVLNNKSVCDKNLLLNLDSHCDNFSQLFSNGNLVVCNIKDSF